MFSVWRVPVDRVFTPKNGPVPERRVNGYDQAPAPNRWVLGSCFAETFVTMRGPVPNPKAPMSRGVCSSQLLSTGLSTA